MVNSEPTSTDRETRYKWYLAVLFFASCLSGIGGALSQVLPFSNALALLQPVAVGAGLGVVATFGAMAIFSFSYILFSQTFAGKTVGTAVTTTFRFLPLALALAAVIVPFPVAQLIIKSPTKKTHMTNPPEHLKSNIRAWPDGFKIEHEVEPQFAYLHSRFGLQCQCGAHIFTVKGVASGSEDYVYPPLEADCTACSSTLKVYDRAYHGWSGSHMPGEYDEKEVPEAFECPHCKKSAFQLAVDFEYPDDSLEEAAADLNVPAENLFTWINVHGKCESCTGQFTILSDESD